jgi:hypothetical protein
LQAAMAMELAKLDATGIHSVKDKLKSVLQAAMAMELAKVDATVIHSVHLENVMQLETAMECVSDVSHMTLMIKIC